MAKKALFFAAAVLTAVLTVTAPASGKLTQEEVARLGNDLTPLGAETAGNADGSIPMWTGGITTQPAGYQQGDFHVDPYQDDSVLFTITADNMDQYADKLSPGLQALLTAYPTYKMNIYPSHRSASLPREIYDGTKATALTAELVEGGNGVANAIGGIPFPIPKNGLEVIWNHLLRYRGKTISRVWAQAVPTRGGDYTLIKFEDKLNLLYYQPDMTLETLHNRVFLYLQEVTAPARLAGSVLLVHETANQVVEPRSAWVYNPGQRRVRRAPNVAYDNPGTASDGARTADQLDMFNGAVDRYDWTLVGKKEMYIPYNAYKLNDPELTYADIVTPLHPNPDVLRYELHRVWVVDAVLKEDARNQYKRRTFYVDEDTWSVVLTDIYDNRDELWRVSEGHMLNYYEVPCTYLAAEIHLDLQSGRYIIIGMTNEEGQPYQFNEPLSEKDFTPSAIRRQGVR
jgi:mannose-6-phosphate isomerase-like protein (cupin superfamily)